MTREKNILINDGYFILALIDWLILRACQPVLGHFVPRDQGRAYVHIFFCTFLNVLHTLIWYQVFLSKTDNLQSDLFDP